MHLERQRAANYEANEINKSSPSERFYKEAQVLISFN